MPLVIAPIEWLITRVLRVGRWLATIAIGIMVLIILTQVFFRYVLNNALPWPDEAARFLMLWMTGLMAPSAYRWGGFVAIDMFRDMMGRRAGALLHLVLLVIAMAVLLIALQLGWKHIKSGWLFNSSSLKIPMQLLGGDPIRIKLAWMYMSLWVGFVAMTIVNLEMILKNLHMLLDPSADYSDVPDAQVMSAE